ncbi:MAG: ABC transporter ATP-binding protein [Candidatus Heimdallarchaeota archaeon]|nr:ABC transporter ATP-binding protein [Candidatus Heimdallarchaeota archaeon]
MRELKWITSYLSRYRLMFFITVFGSVIEIILFTSPNLLVAQLIALFIDEAPLQEIYTWIIYLLIIVVVQALVFYVVATVNELHAHRVTTDMTADLYSTLQQRPQYYHDGTAIGDIMARATGDTRSINIGLSPALRIIVQVITLLITSLTVFMIINIKLSVILIICFPLYAYFVYTYAKKLGPESMEIRKAFGNLSINASETFLGINETKSYVAEQQRVGMFSKISEEHSYHLRKYGLLSAFYPPQLLIAIALGLTTIMGIYLIILGELTLPELVVFVGMISTVQFMSRRIRRIANMTVTMIAAANRLMEMMETDIEPLKFGSNGFSGIKESVEFRDVSFRYLVDREWALRHVNLYLRSGETIAIVGGPGSGKSTFIKLLLRLYDPTEGDILIDGTSLKEYSRENLRARISSIEQNIFLFSDTISANIAFGKPDASLEEIKKVAKLARADEFIESFTNGYDTVIGERGITLSGGQKQRIAIARALLLNPSVLIMDDASSALDAETEFMIQEAIKQVLKTRTSIIITHRLSLIAEADRVLVFDMGRIVALGKHQDILKTSTHYRRLFEHTYELPELEVGS